MRHGNQQRIEINHRNWKTTQVAQVLYPSRRNMIKTAIPPSALPSAEFAEFNLL
jgi:hypothetical protein